jgi:hypothetical protein
MMTSETQGTASLTKETTVGSWKEFEVAFVKLMEAEKAADRQTSSLLFRGQNDSSWKLATTLERAINEAMRVSYYYNLMLKAQSQIETFTDYRWNLPEFPKVDSLLREYDTMRREVFPDLETYRYLIYLRHHGFPSPLLDWTRSYRVAAFFAFRNPPIADHVSLFVYSETPRLVKGGSSDESRINRSGTYIRSHRRHFLQQSEYTMCLEFRDNNTWFVSHETVFDRNEPDQDVLWKFNIPSSERLKVLMMLDEFNLNAFSLFGSEETLMETLATRELYFSRVP